MTDTPKAHKPAKDMTRDEREAELARVETRIANGFSEGSGSPGEWWYERADELRHWMDKDPAPPKNNMVTPETTLTDGSPVTSDHRDINPATGMQKGYVVLSEDERAKGFVRPVRRSYTHLKCGSSTTMGQSLAETYARDPQFYSGTFCASCRNHFPVGPEGEFVWTGTKEKVGS